MIPLLEKLIFVFEEAVYGHTIEATFLDDGTPALLTLLKNTPADKACLPVAGSSLAAQAIHIEFSLQAYSKAVSEDNCVYISDNWPEWPDETAQKEVLSFTEHEWENICQSIEDGATNFVQLLRNGQHFNFSQLGYILGCISHTSFHLGVLQVKYDELNRYDFLLINK